MLKMSDNIQKFQYKIYMFRKRKYFVIVRKIENLLRHPFTYYFIVSELKRKTYNFSIVMLTK